MHLVYYYISYQRPLRSNYAPQSIFQNINIWYILVFEQYQKERMKFVQTVAELATRPQNIETLQNAGKWLLIIIIIIYIACFIFLKSDHLY